MRILIRVKPIYLAAIGEHLVSKHSKFEFIRFSSFTKSSKSKSQKAPPKNPSDASNFPSLLNEITEIFGADTFTAEKPESGFPISQKIQAVEASSTEETNICTKGVRENANVDLFENKSTLLPKQVEFDVSPVVNEVTRIVRADDDVISMEERLENAVIRFEPEVVENVLKRCFKVPRLALRFFNWVKTREAFSHTSGTYNTMLYIAGEAKEFGTVEKLVEDIKNKSCQDIRTWTILISVYGEAKKIGKALLAFEKIRENGHEPDATAYKAIMKALCISGKGDVALEFYKEMVEKDMGLDSSMYKLLLNCIARTCDVEAVRSVADDMVRICNIAEPDVYVSLLKSLFISGKIREALELIRELKNRKVSLDSEFFEILVKGLCRADRIQDALEIVEMMMKKGTVDGSLYGVLINGYLRKNYISEAMNLFHSMKESGHSPSASTYTELMQYFFKIKKYKKGCELFNEMIEKGAKIDSVAITAMVAGHVRENRIAEAWELFNGMEERGIKPTPKCYSIFLKELCRVSRTDEILKVLNQMQASKITIKSEAFQWVISCLEKKGEMDKIESVKRLQGLDVSNSQEQKVSVEEKKLLDDSNHLQSEQSKLMVPPPSDVDENYVQEIYCILKSSAEWSQIEESLEKSTPRYTPEVVTAVIRKSMMLGSTALRFFSWVGNRSGFKHTTETYNMAIKVAGCGKDFKHMRSLYFEMRRKGCIVTPDTWTIMIMQYGRAGLTDIALRTFKEMKDSGLKPNGSSYKCLINVLCGKKGSNVTEAIKRFKEMIRSGFVPDRELAEDYISRLCEVGKLEEAKNCVSSLTELGFSVNLGYSMLIRALCRVGRLDEALSLLEEVETDRSVLEYYTYGSIIHGFLLKGRLEEALTKVESMKHAGIMPSVHVYTSLIVHFFKQNHTDKVLETFQKMQREGCEPSVVTYTAMICGFMNTGNIEEAWNVFKTMKEKGPLPDFITYSKFMNCLCENGKSEDALKLLTEMLDSGISPSTVNFRTVFYGLNRDGKQELARVVLRMKSEFKVRRKVSA